ncbi:TPA: DNA cytosine methyltransferase, partial [Escherichia coli]
GASEGLRQAGFDIELGLDIDQQASETFKANFPDAKFIQDDIRKIEPQDISDIIDIKAKRPLLLSACAPCQPFSQQNKNKTSDDSRRNLLNETHRFIRELLPEYIMLENVPGMQKIDEE